MATFSVLTPCFNAMPWIKACVASVADQQGVDIEHLVQDGGSTDGTAEYVRDNSAILGISEKDDGMYDAINRAWARSTGKYVAHLNADEELLPGALALVSRYFDTHPKVDVVVGGVLICERDGSLLSYRVGIRPPLSIMLTSHHPVQSCGIFFRRSSLADRAWLYNPSFRIISDVLLMIDLVRAQKRIGVLDDFTSVFFMTGKNMGLTQSVRAKEEYAYQMSLAPGWMRGFSKGFQLAFRLQKFLRGSYRTREIAYDIYVPGKGDLRQHLVASKAKGIYSPEQTEDTQR